MPKKSEITRVYLSHDQDTQDDDKVIRMFYEFRKLVETLDTQDLKSLASLSCYAIFWSILEFMHRNSFTVNDIDLLADKLRIKSEFITKVLDDFGFFRKENGEYLSDRMLRDIAKAEEKSKTNQHASTVRWLLSAYSTAYEKEFGTKPVLSQAEKNKLIEYSNQIEDFKQLIPKILKKLHKIKFTTDIGFKARSNWLLKDDNLAQIVNGQYGDIAIQKKEETVTPVPFTPRPMGEGETIGEVMNRKDSGEGASIDLNSITSKAKAIAITKAKFNYFDYLPPDYKKLMKKFDVTKKEFNNAKI